MIPETKVHDIKDINSLLVFLREELNWQLPEGDIEDLTFEWTGEDLNLSEDIHHKLKDGIVRQFQPFRTDQPWGIFVVNFDTKFLVTPIRNILRCLVSKKRGQSPDHPSWDLPNLLFICLYGANGFTFAHFKGDKPFGSLLTTFSWHPGDPIRTVCEFNLPALAYEDKWIPDAWNKAWQTAFDVEKVNKKFYIEIAHLFYRLTNKNGRQRELVIPPQAGQASDKDYEEFAVRLIGRTVFCWFLKHKISNKGVPLIPSDVLSLNAVNQNADYYHSFLEPLFFEVMNKEIAHRKTLNLPKANTIPFLNGGLFEQHPKDFYNNAPTYSLQVPDPWFKDFFTILEKYNFTVSENSGIDVDVSVDPEMLGRIFENLLAEVVPETGETARKATGSYYTPRVIVDYMVEQSLKQYLLNKTTSGEEKVDGLLAYGEDVDDFSPVDKLAVVRALTEIKTIDPACGSGAFPIGVLHRLLMAMEKVDPKLELWQRQYLNGLDPMVRQTVEKNIRKKNWAYIRKLMIIRDAIYGVDIQPIAVEIAKLRCFLSLVVDEMVADSEPNRGIECLPNLEFKFVAANTLIGLPAKIERQGTLGVSEYIKTLKILRDEYLRSCGKEKNDIEHKFRQTQIKLQEENAWLLSSGEAKQLAEWNPFSYKSNGWFEPEWMFGVSCGFDIVIANPPYLKERDNKAIFEPVNQSDFGKKYHQGKMDFWYYFLHKAIDIVAKDGIISYITSRYWLNSAGAKKLMRRVREELSFIYLIDIGKLKVFDEVAGQHMVAIYQKSKDRPEFIYKKVINDLSDLSKSEDTENLRISTLAKKEVFSKNDEIILEKCSFDHSNIILLGDITDISQGVVEATDKVSSKQFEKLRKSNYAVGQGVFVLTGRELDSLNLKPAEKLCIKKYLDPNNVAKYSIIFANRYLVYADNQIKKMIEVDKNYTTLKGHLDHFQCFITSSNKPYGLHRPREEKYFENQKIIFKNMFSAVEFTYDDDDYYFGFSFSSILQKELEYDLKYILAILNSKFAENWFFKNGKKRGAGVDIGVEKLRLFPIKDIPQTRQKPFILLVDQILSITKDASYLSNTDKRTKVNELESEIDQKVDKLYGFTQEEVADSW